jgi:hypothetical protein
MLALQTSLVVVGVRARETMCPTWRRTPSVCCPDINHSGTGGVPKGAASLVNSRVFLSPAPAVPGKELCWGSVRLLFAAYGMGFRMVAELMFYVLTALSFAVGIWFAINFVVA